MNKTSINLANIASATINQCAQIQKQQAMQPRQQQLSQTEMILQRIIDNWPQQFPNFFIHNEFTLREHSPKDIEQFFDYFNNQEVNRYILVTRPTQLSKTAYDVAYNRNLFHKKRGIFWSIICNKTGRLIGTSGIYTNRLPIEVCYDLHPDYWQKGIMTQVAQKIIAFTQSQWPFLNAIRAIILRENIASDSLLKKLGFSWQATSVRDREYKSKWYDVEIYERELGEDLS